MSAIHTGSVAARLTVDGLWQYSGTSEDHAITDWTRPEFDALIPTQRAGSAYEQVVLTADDDLADLSDLVPVPSFRQFVAENPNATQTANHTTAGGERQ